MVTASLWAVNMLQCCMRTCEHDLRNVRQTGWFCQPPVCTWQWLQHSSCFIHCWLQKRQLVQHLHTAQMWPARQQAAFKCLLRKGNDSHLCVLVVHDVCHSKEYKEA